MKANVILNTKSESEAQRHEAQLKKNGYKLKENCYWTEIFNRRKQYELNVDIS